MMLSKRMIAVITAAILFFASIPFLTITVYANSYTNYITASCSNTEYEKGFNNPKIFNVNATVSNDPDGSYKLWTELRASNTLPIYVTQPYITLASGAKRGFNFRLWKAKHLAVYGEPTDVGVNPRIPEQNGYRDWKTKKDSPTCSEYFLRDSERGDYRYYGYDVDKKLFPNPDYPLDGKTDFVNNHIWYYKPWAIPHSIGKQSIWNIAAERDYDKAVRMGQTPSQSASTLANWIIKGMYKDGDDLATTKFESEVSLTFENKETPNDLTGMTQAQKDDYLKKNAGGGHAYNYVNINSAPTMKYPGEATLWLKGPVSGRDKYRTAFIKPIESKLRLPIGVTGNVIFGSLKGVVDRGNQNTTAYLNSTRELKIQVVGTLQDESYYKDQVQSTIYYTRKDFAGGDKSWEFSLGDMNGINQVKTGATAGNTGKYTFSFNVKISKILADYKAGIRKYTVPVSVKGNFNNIYTPGDIISFPSDFPTVYYIDIPIEVVKPALGTVTEKHVCGSNTLAEEVHENLPPGTYKFSARAFTGYSYSSGQPLEKSAIIDETHCNVTVTFNYDGIPPPPGEEWDMPLSQYIEPNIYLPEPAFDIVDYKPTDNTSFVDAHGDPIDIIDRQVYVDGTPVDYYTFFSGSYVFGEIGYDRLVNIVVSYTASDGAVSNISRWIRVLNTKPRVQFAFSGGYKQNRKQSAANTSVSANTPDVIAAYPISSYSWSVEAVGTDEGDGTNADIRTGTATDMLREVTFKKPGNYKITLTGTNTLGRTSAPYIYEFQIFPDVKPAVICELNKVSIARGESISAYFFESVSTDGDQIESTEVSLFYDADNDDEPETLVNTWAGVKNGEFPSYTADKLGKYRWEIVSKEKMMGEIIPSHVSSEDATVIEKTRDFWVDNYIPQTGVYINVPIVRPTVDLFILTDSKLSQEKIDVVKNSRMDFNNYLRYYNILPVVEHWDMKMYIYSQPANDTTNTGQTYPSDTILYSSNGYSGTLSRTSVSDNGSNQDFGSYQTKTETKTVSGTQSRTCTFTWNSDGYSNDSSTADIGSTMSYSDGEGYSGTLSRTSTSKTTSPTSDWTTYKTVNGKQVSVYWHSYTNYYTAYFSGTVSRTVTYWVSNWRWVSNYTGFYSGTIYKNVRQPYVDPFRSTSQKFVLYITDANITDLSDLQMVVGKSGAKLILIGPDSATGQISSDKSFPNTSNVVSDVEKVLKYIADNNQAIEEYYVVAGQDTFTLNVDDYDAEGDPIISKQFQYVQDQNYFDNAQGMESFAQENFSQYTGWVGTSISKLNKTGKFNIYRRIQDHPSTDPRFAQYDYHSGTPMLVIYSHRKPIANASLDWDFDSTINMYNTNWVDHSYDKDHQYNRPDKGIVERKIMFRQVGGDWSYVIPDKLAPGTYELQYYVKDPEGAWSEPFTMNFSLNPAPPMQFDASLRTLDNKFTLQSVPASEYLEVYDAWTRFPYNVYLTAGLYNGSNLVAPLQTINYTSTTGAKNGNDILWKDISYQIPATLSEGTYILRVKAIGDYNQSAYKDFTVSVNTPINLAAKINGNSSNAEIYADSLNTFTFDTSTYVTSVKLDFKGKTYTSDSGSISLVRNDGATKTWEIKQYVSPASVSDNETGFVSFTASIPSGKKETFNVNYKVITIQAYDFTITSMLDVNWRGYFFDLTRPINGEGEIYGYPRKFGTDIKTIQMPINSLNLLPYSVNSVQAGCKVKGYIRVKGNPDTLNLIAYYMDGGIVKSSYTSIINVNGAKYDFEWIIPQETDQNTYVTFDISIRKGNSTYGSDKWIDTWNVENSSKAVFYVKGKVTDSIKYTQSN